MKNKKASLVRSLVMLGMPHRFTHAMLRKKIGAVFPDIKPLLKAMRDNGQLSCEREPGTVYYWYSLTPYGRQQAEFAYSLLAALDLLDGTGTDQIENIKAAANVVISRHKHGESLDAAIYDLEGLL
jgi:hypothetical protein